MRAILRMAGAIAAGAIGIAGFALMVAVVISMFSNDDRPSTYEPGECTTSTFLC